MAGVIRSYEHSDAGRPSGVLLGLLALTVLIIVAMLGYGLVRALNVGQRIRHPMPVRILPPDRTIPKLMGDIGPT